MHCTSPLLQCNNAEDDDDDCKNVVYVIKEWIVSFSQCVMFHNHNIIVSYSLHRWLNKSLVNNIELPHPQCCSLVVVNWMAC